MKLIVGLGNPGAKYLTTRHNVGFILVDLIASENSAGTFKSGHKGEVGQFFSCKQSVLLFKPMSYMNLSGQGVSELVRYRKISATDILVIYDDIDLPWGDVRYRSKGGHGGHNGMRDIIGTLGSNDIKRLKIGVGRPKNGSVSSWVLGDLTTDELSELRSSVYENVWDKVCKFIKED